VQSAWPLLRAAQLLRLHLFRIELRHLRVLVSVGVKLGIARPERIMRSVPPAIEASNAGSTRTAVTVATVASR
jgi:hypothetical protein